jgi:hypothetical protein
VEREHNVSEMAEKVPRHQTEACARRSWEIRGKAFPVVADVRPQSTREDPCREESANGWREITRWRAGERVEASGWRSRPETPSTPTGC